jgi:hypothetical protein
MQRHAWQLKFVVRSSEAAGDLDEVEQLLRHLAVPASERHRVLVMPECTDAGALHASYRTLVAACIERGFRLGERLHIALFGHTPGT